MTGTHDAGTWEILRQVVIGARDLDKTGQQLREALNLAPGFTDPLLEDIGLADETLAVGPQAFLEIVAPLDETVSLARWIRKGGGEGGYALSIQVSNIEPYLERAAAADVRTVADLEAYGHRIVQLHPGDLGLLVELDEIPDADEWFWDETEKEVSLDPWVDDILGVDVSSSDPARTATLWAEVFGKKPVSAQPLSIRLGSRVVSFVPGERSMLTAIDLAASSGASAVEPGLSVGGVEFRIHPR
ncbi:hypothetical protein LQ424_02155 [Rhodococcus qingshengii]|uniref:hypothetical protein n=1 Tax=Rhodococcus TaxID=1827 RepID=UPI0005A92A87|nr:MULTISPECIES: hypothetical protein [Rhodococcus]MBP2524509.1 hypothetical protein [Rhodococcus sp. PvP104]MCD2130573.1 hypothetical protein [Rhodococcus qingshengii]MDA3634261.1 hypothetical protein [Rhodococcus sp. C-2]WNF40392.1 hypothetical protein RHP72_21765 [Rhodococcus sp. SG20037]